LANTDGSGLEQLTTGLGVVSFSWSPDGEQIAFLSDVDGPGGLYLVSTNGSGRTRLAQEVSGIADFSWSPDGGRIAFVDGRSVYRIGADGSGLTELPTDLTEPFDVAWSPLGSQVAVVATIIGTAGEGPGLFVMNEDGTQVAQVATYAEAPAWSPDGNWLAFTRPFPGSLCIVQADGANLRCFEGTTPSRYPVWSPNGLMLLFSFNQGASEWDLDVDQVYIISTGGGAPRRLSTTPGQPPYAWSSGGGRIVYTQGFWADARVYIMNTDGTDPRPLLGEDFQGLDPAWRP
jgi:Tol biopolymer transport system component